MRIQSPREGYERVKLEVQVFLTPADIAVISDALLAQSSDDTEVSRRSQELSDDFRRLQREHEILDVPVV